MGAEGVRGGADQSDGTKPPIATDKATSGAFLDFNVGVSKLAVGGLGVADLVDATHRMPVELSASDLAALETITAAVSNALDLSVATLAALETIQVGSLPSLPAGSASIGKLGANSGVDIGDVDVTSVPADPFGANADAIVAAGAVGSISAKLRRVTQGLADVVAALSPGNTNLTVFPSAARTATPAPFDSGNSFWRGLHLVIDVQAITATPSVVFEVQGFDAVSGKLYTILQSVPIVAVGTYVLKVYPGIGAIPNGAASDILPRNFRVIATHGDADSITYSVGASVIV